MQRRDIISELAKMKPASVTLPKVIPESLPIFKEFFGLTDVDLAVIFEATTTAIRSKIKSVEDRGILVRRDDGVLTLKAFMDDGEDFESMTIDQKIAWIDKQFDLNIQAKGTLLLKEQMAALKARRIDLVEQRNQETSEGKDLIVGYLKFLRETFTPAAEGAFEKAFKNLKREIAYRTVTTLWNIAKERNVMSFRDEEDEKLTKDQVLDHAYRIAEAQGNDFSLRDIFKETFDANEFTKSQIDQYLQRTGTLKLTGGGIVKQDDSVTGGAQFRQKHKEEEREQEQRRREF